jgi:DHA1 family bicyclomycin/chloramphenicol resistance-like MFS transporter
MAACSVGRRPDADEGHRVRTESLPRERRHGGGLRQFASGLSQVLRIRLYVGYMLTAALSGFTMMAYIANSSYVLQVQKGLRPLPFAPFFASTALAQILLSVVTPRSSAAGFSRAH